MLGYGVSSVEGGGCDEGGQSVLQACSAIDGEQCLDEAPDDLSRGRLTAVNLEC